MNNHYGRKHGVPSPLHYGRGRTWFSKPSKSGQRGLDRTNQGGNWGLIFREEGVGGHGSQPVIGDCQSGASGLLLRVVGYVDEFGDAGIFCPPQMNGGKHGNSVGTLDTTTVY